MLETAVFYVFAAVLLYAGLRVITARNPVHGALHLVLAFFTAAGLWLLLYAEFLAIVLVVVYVGAVMVLFLFVVMMLDINIERVREGFWRNLPLALLVGGVMVVEMVFVIGKRFLDTENLKPVPAGTSNTRQLGRVLYTDYAYAFEIAAVVLLVALMSLLQASLSLLFSQVAPVRSVANGEGEARRDHDAKAQRQEAAEHAHAQTNPLAARGLEAIAQGLFFDRGHGFDPALAVLWADIHGSSCATCVSGSSTSASSTVGMLPAEKILSSDGSLMDKRCRATKSTRSGVL